jgi:hypothetical protein
MTTRGRSLIRRARRLNESDGPMFLTIEGNPEVSRLRTLGHIPPDAMGSDRDAMIGHELFVALDDETTGAFHRRLRQIAKERGVLMIELGHESNNVKLKEAPPYFSGGARPAGVTIN